ALVVLGGEMIGHPECRLALQNFRGMCRGRDRVAHLRECSGEKGMMGVVGPRDPRERLGRFSVFFRTIAGAPEMAPEALGVIGIEAHRLLDPVDTVIRPSEPG